jgi:two-component system, OmpR family, sensor kinase
MMTIRTRLALWYSGLLTLLIITFSIAIITMSRVIILQTLDGWLAEIAAAVVTHIEINPEMDSVTFHADATLHTPGISFQLWQIANTHTGASMEPLAIYDSEKLISNASAYPLNAAGLHVSEPHFGSIPMNNILERVHTHPVYTAAGVLMGVVQVSTPIQSTLQSNRLLLLITLLAAVLCIGISIGLGIGLSRHLLKPVKAITAAAASIVDAQALSTRLDWQGPQDELGELTAVFNSMMERLEHLFTVQQRFVGDVSHELRTPLTSILGNLELISLYGVEQEALDAIQREAKRMKRMVDDLMLLTRADYGELELEFYSIDLDTIAIAVYEATVERLQDRNLSIIMERVEPVSIVGNGERLRQLLANLLHNATKFTGDGGSVALAVYREDSQAIITVRDTGIGISAENQKHIFDRFFQADTARVYRDETDGAGLGLSIVRWIVDAHHGTIEVQSVVNEGTLFRVCLPLEMKAPQSQPPGVDATAIATLKIKTQPRMGCNN